MTANEPIRILVADDHAQVREGLTLLLTREKMQVIGQAADGREAVEMHREHRPDITLMDLRMPRMDGISAIRAIVEEFPSARIVVLTNLDDEEENCLSAGAKAVLLKDASKGEIIATIQAVHQVPTIEEEPQG